MKKQNLKRIITIGLIATSLITVAPIQANAEWKRSSSLDPSGNVQYNGWYYTNSDGSHKTGWLFDNGNWYYLNPSRDGYMENWTIKTIDGIQYGFDRDGKMINGKVNWNSNKTEATINGVQYDNIKSLRDLDILSGGVVSLYDLNKTKIPYNYYEFHVKGTADNYKTGGKFKYFLVDPNTNEILLGKVINPVDGKTYLTDYEGILQLGFQLNNSNRMWEYYNRETGALETGVQNINGKTYDLNDPHLNDFNYEARSEFISSNDESTLSYTKDYLIENSAKQGLLNAGVDEEKYMQIMTSTN